MRVSFEDGAGKDLDLRDSGDLATCLRRAGVLLNTRCGGRGVCKGCRVELVAGDFENGNGPLHVSSSTTSPTVRACQTKAVSASGEIRVPQASLLQSTMRVEDAFQTHTFEFRRFFDVLEVTLPACSPDGRGSDVTLLIDMVRARLNSCEIDALGLELSRRLAHLLAGYAERKLRVIVEKRASCARVVDIHHAGGKFIPLGLAVDIGTTTVATLLVDLTDGSIIARASGYNEQVRVADDVASRLVVVEREEGLEEMRRLIVHDTINVLLGRMLKDSRHREEEVVAVALAGNTIMSHLALGLDPRNIGRVPFTPVARIYPVESSVQVGINANRGAGVRVLPAVSGYVGGDLTADMYSCGLLADSALTLLVDIGTNGEMILSEGTKLLGTATAAGPAFEGAGIQCGVRASNGAIEHLRLYKDGGVDYQVIGGGKPHGLCGSAIVDFIASAYETGFLSSMGRFDVDLLRATGKYATPAVAIKKEFATHGFRVVCSRSGASGGDIIVTEHDVAEVLKAKAAIYAGMKTLLAEHGARFSDVQRLVLAGGFARHLDIRAAVAMGLLPEIPPERYRVVGNGSLAGAYLTLVEEGAWESFHLLADMPQIVELNKTDCFEDYFVEALAIPNLDDDDFPGIHFAERTTLP